MQKYSFEWANKMLELNPDWMAIAVAECGICFWSKDILIPGNYFWLKEDGYLGKFTYDGDWKDTLVVRKCDHNITVYPEDWKYCPKCGEFLGSK